MALSVFRAVQQVHGKRSDEQCFYKLAMKIAYLYGTIAQCVYIVPIQIEYIFY